MHATPSSHQAGLQPPYLIWSALATASVPERGQRMAVTHAGDDARFVSLLNAYRQSGGLARAEEVNRMFTSQRDAKDAPRAAWLARRCWIAFEWEAQTWLPRFQFLPAGLLPAPTLGAVLDELDPVFSAWEVAEWFARGNSCLGGRTPVDALGEDPRAVLHAARCDRYIARG